MIFVSHHLTEKKIGLTIWTDELEQVGQLDGRDFSGLCRADDSGNLFAVDYGSGVVYRITTDFKQEATGIKATNDVHGIAMVHDLLAMTDTATDRVRFYDVGSCKQVAEWSAGKELADLHHINGICASQGPGSSCGELVVSVAVMDSSLNKRIARQGGLVDIGPWWRGTGLPRVIRRGLSLPHTPFFFGNCLWFVESSPGILWCNDRLFWSYSGFLRGLSVSQDKIIVGSTGWNRGTSGYHNNQLSCLFWLNGNGMVVRGKEMPLEFGQIFEVVWVPESVPEDVSEIVLEAIPILPALDLLPEPLEVLPAALPVVRPEALPALEVPLEEPEGESEWNFWT